MKKILCFGDSNVYGFNPNNGKRFPDNIRWASILKNLCKPNYKIIEAGCNNRTCFKNNPVGIEQTGYKVLPNLLNTDLYGIILSLGINDLQFQYNTTENEIKNGINNIINLVKNNCPNAKIIILGPSEISNCIKQSFFQAMFDDSSIELSKKIGEIYKNIANENNCIFIYLNDIATVSKIDGLHYDENEHYKIANYLYNVIKQL